MIMCHSVFMHDPRQVSFQCSPETPKGRTPVLRESVTCLYQFRFTSLDTTCLAC